MRILSFLDRFSFFIFFTLLLASFVLLFSFFKPDEESSYIQDFKSNYAIFALDIPDEVEFAGERIPLEYFDVYESFDRELMVNTYWHSQTLLFIKRANRYFPVIEPILEKHGVPDDFKYLALAESGLTNAISPARAVGYWQFLRETAREYGLTVTDEVDERYHLEKSTEAACKFLKESYEKYGSWTMAAASYNAGRRGMDNQIRIQEEENYYDLLLNEETARYIFRIAAIKTIMENPGKYGFRYRKSDLYQPVEYYEVEIGNTIDNFADFAKEHGTNYKMLKFLNPWLRKPYLNVRNRTYVIKIPAEESRLRVPQNNSR